MDTKKLSMFLMIFLIIGISLSLYSYKATFNSSDIDDFYMPLIRTHSALMEDVLDEYQLVVAYIYQLSDQEQLALKETSSKSAHRYDFVDKVYKTFENYAQDHLDEFADAGDRAIKFIGVNLEHGDLNTLKSKYSLESTDSFVLFYKGQLQSKYPITEPFTTTTLKTLLNQAKFDDFLNDEIRKQARKERAEEKRNAEKNYSRRYRRRSYYSRPVVSFGYGYGPYYNGYYWGEPYYPYYSRPGFGIGFGW